MIGGGFIGRETTASLTQLGERVTHVVRARNVFAALQTPPLSEALHDLYRERGVDLRLGSTDAPEADDFTGNESLDGEGDFRAGKAIGRFRKDGRTIAAVTTGQDDAAHEALREEIRASAAADG